MRTGDHDLRDEKSFSWSETQGHRTNGRRKRVSVSCNENLAVEQSSHNHCSNIESHAAIAVSCVASHNNIHASIRFYVGATTESDDLLDFGI